MRRLLLAALLLATVAIVTVPIASGGTREVVEKLQGEKAECDFLLFLCREANRSIDQAASTPGTADVIGFKNANRANLHVRDAVEAADAIAAKHPPGKQPWCLGAPQCSFLKDARSGR